VLDNAAILQRVLLICGNPCSGKLKKLYDSGNHGCKATPKLITFSWDMWHPLFLDQTIFDFPTSTLITFTTKSYLRSKTYTAYKFYTLYPQKEDFQRRIFVVRRKRHRSVFPSWCRKTLYTRYRWFFKGGKRPPAPS